MQTRIRPATAADAAALADLAAVTFPLACPPSTSAESIAAFIAEHLTAARFAEYVGDPHRTVLVVEREDDRGPSALAGWSMLVRTPDGAPADADAAASVTARPAIELSKMYAHPDTHGTGVASQLMAATLDAAAVGGAVTAWLGVNEENARAIRFYEKHGFAKVGRKRFRVGDRLEHDWVLERTLDGGPAG